MVKKNLLLSLLFFFYFSSYAADYHDFKLDGIYYKIESRENQTVSVCAPTWNSSSYYGGDVVIPSTINYAGYDFTVIGISHGAFRNCYYIKSLTLPLTLQWVSQQSFESCKIEKLNILDVNKWAQIEFSYLGTPAQVAESIYVNGSVINELTLAEGVSSVGNYAFAYFKDLQSISFPESLSSIGDFAFGECNKLSVVNMPKTLTSIGRRAFYGTVIKEIIIPEGVTTIEEETFWGYQSMKKITLPSTMKTIKKDAFWCSLVEELIVSANIPPVIEVGYDGDGLSHIDKIACKVYVPQNSIQTYKNDSYWGNFWTYMPIDENGQSTSKCTMPIISYNNGKLSFSCDTEGAVFHSTITDNDITSYSTNEISLSATYNISVYATAEGYGKSDIATATLCWIDVEPKSEGLSNNVAQVRANAVLIQSDNGRVTVSGLDYGTNIVIYSVSGHLIGSTKVQGNKTSIITNLKRGDIAIVKIGDKSVKVVMQ